MTLFSDIKFGDDAAMKDFLLANADSHSQVAAFLVQKGKQVDSKPITDMGNIQDWLAIHSDIHNQELSHLGVIDMPNLVDVDFSNEQEYSEWHIQHALLHLYVQQALGLS